MATRAGVETHLMRSILSKAQARRVRRRSSSPVVLCSAPLPHASLTSPVEEDSDFVTPILFRPALDLRERVLDLLTRYPLIPPYVCVEHEADAIDSFETRGLPELVLETGSEGFGDPEG